MPTPVLSNQSPCQVLFQTSPNYSKLKIFCCLCFPCLRPYTSHKLDPRSIPCIFLGYSLTQSAYICLDPNTNRVYVSRYVIFDESTFPNPVCRPSSPETTAEHAPLFSPSITQIPFETPPLTQAHLAPLGDAAPSASDSAPDNHASNSPSPATHQQQPGALSPLHVSDNNDDSGTLDSENSNGQPTASENSSPNSLAQQTSSTQDSAQQLSGPSSTGSQRISQPQPEPSSSSTSSDSIQPKNRHQMKTRAKNNIRKPNQKYGLAALLLSGGESEPRTITQALKDNKWRSSASAEFDAQVRNHTWDLVPPSPGLNVIDCRWLFRIKYLPDGTIDKCKSRLVSKGYNQQEGIDYFETFSPVIKSTTFHTVLNVATSRNWCLRQIDINNAFLQGNLTEEVYMRQHPGFVDPDKPHHICRLNKAIYGLKQAPRAWYVELKTFLLQLGFQNSVADTALFVLQQGDTLTYLLVYVDDIIVTGNNQHLVERILKALASRFSLKDMGELSYFLGIKVIKTSQGLHLSQRKYILDLLHKMDMQEAKPAPTPMATDPKLTLAGEKHSNMTEYRTLVGNLQYLSFTRPDIAYAVNKLSQFMHSPTTDHWQAAKRVLRYLSQAHPHSVSSIVTRILSLYMLSLMLIGQETLMTTSPLMHTLSTLASTLSHGQQESSRVLLALRLKLSTDQLLTQPLSSTGLVTSSLSSVSHNTSLQLFTATTLELHIYVLIRFFTLE